MLGMEWLFVVDSFGRSGGLALLWSPQHSVLLFSYSQHFTGVEITMANEVKWQLTGYYTKPNHNRMHELWACLRTLAGRSSLPWLSIGNFNNILYPIKKHGGHPQPKRLIARFRTATEEASPFDIRMIGHPFT